MGNFTLVGARPGVGKTEFAVDYAISKALIEGRRIMYFCPLRKKDLFQEEIEERANIRSDIFNQLVLNDSTGLSICQIADICVSSKCDMAILDELDEFCDSRYKPGVERVFKNLNDFSKEYSVDVIVLSNLLESVDVRDGFIPELEDVKHSEVISKYLDCITLLTKPALYDDFSKEKGIVVAKEIKLC